MVIFISRLTTDDLNIRVELVIVAGLNFTITTTDNNKRQLAAILVLRKSFCQADDTGIASY
jgi:hypothetical protein